MRRFAHHGLCQAYVKCHIEVISDLLACLIIPSNHTAIVDESVCTYAVWKTCAVDKGGTMESGKLKLSGQLAFVPKETYPRLVVHPPPLSLTSILAPRSLRTSACMLTPPPYYMEPQLCSSFLKYFLNIYNYVYIVMCVTY